MTGPVPTRDQALARLGRVLASSCERQYGGRWTSVRQSTAKVAPAALRDVSQSGADDRDAPPEAAAA